MITMNPTNYSQSQRIASTTIVKTKKSSVSSVIIDHSLRESIVVNLCIQHIQGSKTRKINKHLNALHLVVLHSWIEAKGHQNLLNKEKPRLPWVLLSWNSCSRLIFGVGLLLWCIRWLLNVFLSLGQCRFFCIDGIQDLLYCYCHLHQFFIQIV